MVAPRVSSGISSGNCSGLSSVIPPKIFTQQQPSRPRDLFRNSRDFFRYSSQEFSLELVLPDKFPGIPCEEYSMWISWDSRESNMLKRAEEWKK